MAPEAAPGNRKRARPQEDDPDSSPAAASSTKKRRTNGHTTVSPPAPRRFSALTSAIGSVLGLGRRSSAKKSAPSAEQQSAPENSAYDSDVEEDESHKSPARSVSKASSSSAKTRPKASEKNVYDVPSSGDELEFPGDATIEAEPKGKSQSKQRLSNGLPKASESPQKSRSGSRKARAPDSEYETAPEGSSSRASSRARGRLPTTSGANVRSSTDDLPPKNGIVQRPAVKDFIRRRGKPAQKGTTVDSAPPTPKGILTPRHRRPGRPRKSVAFENDDSKPVAEVFFEDLPTKAKSQPSRAGTARKVTTSKDSNVDGVEDHEEEEEEGEGTDEDSEDDEVCAVCGKSDSKAPNEIIFCENCDKAVHQKCYGVPVIPEDDWFCRDCLQEDVVSTSPHSSAQRKATISKDVPDIANFEKHLQVMQRVLIDRCLGNRRIKPRGLEEAYGKAYQLVEQTVLAGEGNSMMIIGARGSGKTLVSHKEYRFASNNSLQE